MIELYKLDEDVWINVNFISEITSDLCGGYFIYLNIIDGDNEQIRHRVSKKIGDYLIEKYSIINIPKKIIPAKPSKKLKYTDIKVRDGWSSDYHEDVVSKSSVKKAVKELMGLSK